MIMSAIMWGFAKISLAIIGLTLAFLAGASASEDKPANTLFWAVLAVFTGVIGAFI